MHAELWIPQDMARANELYLKAGGLGCVDAYFNLGIAYQEGRGVEIDMKKVNYYYYELAAMNGYVAARHNLGNVEGHDGNHQRAFKHFMLAASAGLKGSLVQLRQDLWLDL